MGSVCCCLHVEPDPEESTDETIRGGCRCPGCLFSTLFSKNAKVITRDERIHNDAAILDPNAAPNNAQTETIMNHLITLPHFPNLIISNNQHEEFKEGEDVADQLHEITEEQTRSREVQAEQKSDDHIPKTLNSSSHEKPDFGDYFACTSADDEDECPTCLEAYESENPKILTECNHHFHLGCIYEWMERSATCPICSKVVVFSERSLN